MTRPCHSIVNQAFSPRLRLDPRRPINGDGFGVGWYDSVYDEELGAQPCIFTSSTPVSGTFSPTFETRSQRFGAVHFMTPFRPGITPTSFDWPRRSNLHLCCKHLRRSWLGLVSSVLWAAVTDLCTWSRALIVDMLGRRLQGRSRWIIVILSGSESSW